MKAFLVAASAVVASAAVPTLPLKNAAVPGLTIPAVGLGKHARYKYVMHVGFRTQMDYM